jgi:hypothetical protein
MKSRYLKPTFRSGRSSVDIWAAITWNIKGPIHFVQKEGRMNSEIYVNQMLHDLRLSFYEKCARERDYMIWMNDDADYHIFKMISQWRQENELKRINWLTQLSDLILIENLWRLIKLRISDRRHRVHSLEDMKRIIQTEWNKLTMNDFRASIESMSRRCQTVIKTREEFINIRSYNHSDVDSHSENKRFISSI